MTERNEITAAQNTVRSDVQSDVLSDVLDGLDSLEVMEASDLEEGVAFHAFRFKSV